MNTTNSRNLSRSALRAAAVLLLTLVFLLPPLLLPTPAHAAARTFTGPGNFSDAAKWDGGITLPTTSDNLTINGTCTFDDTRALTYGTLVVGGSSAGTLNWPASSTNVLTVSSVSSSVASSAIDMTNGGTLQVSGTWTVTNLTLTPGTGTVEFNGGAQTVPAVATFKNLTLSGSGAKTLTVTTTAVSGNLVLSGTATTTTVVALTISGSLSVGSGTTFTAAGFTIAVTGATTVDGALTITSTTGTKTFTGDVTINSGGVLSETVAELITYGGNVTINSGGTLTEFAGAAMSVAGNFQSDGTYTAATGAHTFSGTGKTISGASAISIPSLTLSGTYTNNGTLTVSTAMAGSGTLTQGASATLNIGDSAIAPTLVATAAGNIVNFNRAGTQTIKATTGYYHLTTSGTSTKSSGAATTVAGTLTIGSGTTLDVTAGDDAWSVGGDWTNDGAFTARSGTITLNGAGAQVIGGSAATTFNNLTLSGSGAKTTTGSTVNGILSMEGTATTAGTAPTYGAAATLQYKGSSAQTTGTEFTTPWAGTGGVIINNASGVGLGAVKAINTTLTLTAGAFTLTNALTMATGSTISRGNGSLSTTPTFAGTVNVTYTGATAGVATGPELPTSAANVLNNLTINNSGQTITLGAAVTVNGDFTITAGTFDVSASNYAMTVKGAWTNGGTFTTRSGTVTLGGADQSVATGTTFYNLTTSGSGTKTLGATLTVNNAFTVGSGTIFTVGAHAIDITGVTTLSGQLNITSTTGAKNFGDVIVNSGGTWNESVNDPVSFSGSLQNDGTFTAGTSAHTFTGSSKTFSGTNTISIPSLTISGAGASYTNNGTLTVGTALTVTGASVTLTNNGTVTASTALSGTGGLTQGAAGTLNIGGTSGITTLTASTSGNTVNYTGGAQTVKATTYSNLTLSGSGAKTMTSVTTINGNFTLSGTATAAPPAGLTVGGTVTIGSGTTFTGGALTHNVAGDWTNNGATVTLTGTTINLNGSSSQAIGGSSSTTFVNLTINNSSGVVLGINATVDGILTLTSGNLAVTDPSILTMGASATTTGTKDVTGIVKRTTLVASTSYTFGSQNTVITLSPGGTVPTDLSVKIAIGSAPAWKTGAVQRVYDIFRTGGTGTATVRLRYLDSELNGNTESQLVIWDDDVEEHGRSDYDTTNNWVQMSSLDITYWPTASGLQSWALANSALTSFTWNGSVSTAWATVDNWTPNGVPSDQSDVVIPDAATTSNDPTLPSSATISRMTLNSGGILNAPAGGTLTVGGASGAWSDSGGTFSASTSTVVFTNAAATISGTTDFYNVTIDPGAILAIEPSSTTRIAGTITNNGAVTHVAGEGSACTVEYNGASQTVINPNGSIAGYHNLILSGSGTKTMPGAALSINGNFTISGTASATAGAAINTTGSFTVGSGTSFTTGAFAHTIGGNFSNSGTFTATGSTVTLNGASGQAMTGATTFNNLTMNNSSGLTISSNETVNGALTLTSGNITTGANNVIIASGGSVSRTSGHVIGNLRKVATVSTIAFEVGTATAYAPISIAISALSGSSPTVTASTTDGVHGSLGNSGISTAKYANRYWTLTPANVTTVNYDAQFTFADPGDLVGSPTKANFIVRKYDTAATAWSRPPGGSSNSGNTSTGAGFTSFSQYAAGEPLTWASTENPVTASPLNMNGAAFGASSNYNIAYYDAGGGAPVALITNKSSDGAGALTDSLSLQPSWTPGAWHAVVQPATGYADMSGVTYAAVSANQASFSAYGVIGDGSFTVNSGALPELPTAAVGALVLTACFAIYYWRRKNAARLARS